jgi:Tol biopolymer transport system component
VHTRRRKRALIHRRVVKARLVLGALTVSLLVLSGPTNGATPVPPPADELPVWSPDSSKLAFVTSRGRHAVAVAAADGSGQSRLVEIDASGAPSPDPSRISLSPDWQWAAVVRLATGGNALVAVRLDDGEERRLADAAYGTRPAWAPDSKRVAFRSADGTLAVVGVDGSGLARLADGGSTPSWSPDGTRIAYEGGTPQDVDIHVVGPSGDADLRVAGGPGAQLEPKWSPDGASIAFLTQTDVGKPFALAVARADGSGLRTYPGPGVSNRDGFSWTPDGHGIVFARDATQGIFRLDLETGEARRLTTFGGMPSLSPDGTRIAFAGSGECRDRIGIYVVTAAGKQLRRLTNGCRIVGTARDDVLHGTAFTDVLIGRAGNDRLLARSNGFAGDTLLGGAGNDVLVSANGQDVLEGGRGNDRLLSGASPDVLRGGGGRDSINGQGGRDRLHARDGRRDVVTCGNARDEAWVDRYDRVARDCERVHRSR